MKNYILIFAALLLGNCARHGDEPLTPSQEGNTLKATFELSPPLARSGMNAEGRFVWKAGDAVGVMSSVQLDANIAYQLDPACADTEQGTFIGGATKVRPGDAYYAYYPYALNARITDQLTLRMTVPAVQTYEPASFPTMANPAVSVSATADSYTFRNTCGFLRILLSGDAVVTEIILRAGLKSASTDPYQTMFSGSGDVDLSAADPVLVLDESYGDNSREIKINCGAGVQLNRTAPTPFIAVVPAGTYRPVTVEILLSTGERYSYVRAGSDNRVVVARNAITTFGEIDVTETPLTAVEEIDNTYTVSKPSEWNWIAVQVDGGTTFEGKTVALSADLDFAGLKFIPMGCSADYMTDSSTGTTSFMGTLDGQGHKFLNVTINQTVGRGRGIIGQGKNATIRRVTVENMRITGPGKWTAGLVGLMSGGTVTDCHIAGLDIDPAETIGDRTGLYLSYRLGGLVGLWNTGAGTITNCSVTGAVIRGAAIMGGLVGSTQGEAKSIGQCSVSDVKIYHKDTDFTVAPHYGSYNPPFYVSAPVVGEAAAPTTLTGLSIGAWEIHDETGCTCRLSDQNFTALPYAGILDAVVSVDGVQLVEAVPQVTTERTIIGNGTTIEQAPVN